MPRKAPLYSTSRARAGKKVSGQRGRSNTTAAVLAATEPQLAPAKPGLFRRGAQLFHRYDRAAAVLCGVLFTLGALWTYDKLQPTPQNLTQEDLDDAVLQTWNTHVMPSEATRAYQRIRGSVVMVRGLSSRRDDDKPDERADHDHSGDNHQDDEKPNAMPDREARGIGTGVVLVDDGVILTNLHVVSGSPRIEVIFADGTKSPARIIEIQRENDLAVLKAMTVPENLPPATVRSSSDLQPGDKVIAVGFPFGIGPSVSSGIVSGLKRQFSSADGEETLKNLIQFDASANPGNSGGPLVTMDGSVVGIVTGILNPSEHRTFAGIGFAVPIDQATGGGGSSPF